MRYALDCKKKQIQFNFKIINMTLFMIENVSIDLETNQSMSAVPYPITSKSLFIKSMSTRQIIEWNCFFVLHNYDDIQNCKLRIQIPPNDSCPSTEYDEDIEIGRAHV